ncbi:Protein kes1 [Pleurostoma richardsiae]|uniref:Protein kes1 n=1 Tax=Pleurostoma richardsiae TaxID=41990 RepID=A0AA38VK73_9PEZI|nr:Protein kes1 [Pleurostoma richardsiae]
MDASISSRLRDLVKFLSSVKGDLSNVTAPPSFLAPSSVVEVGHCWAQRPEVFAAPALEPCPEKRSLLVLRLVLIALRSQLYIAGSPAVSIKKPLNAFLGELFLASWTHPECGSTTRLAAEQVSHHPPVTAMHIADEKNGVRADGYARVEMTGVNIRQIGHAVLHVDRFDEDYLIPLPDVRVCGFLSGRLYPEVQGTYKIISSTGYVSEIRFSGAGFTGGKKNGFEARTYRRDDPKKRSIYEASGSWSEGWTVRDARSGEVLERYDCDAEENEPAPMSIRPHREQDPWESRKAWAGVISGIEGGDFRQVIEEKSRLEQAQRDMRACEAARGHKWKPLLFDSGAAREHHVFHRLVNGTDWKLSEEKTKGVWRIDKARLDSLQGPFRGDLTPLG